jgi:hypothetical protein
MDATEVGWGKYKNWRGPFIRGTQRYFDPSDMTESDRIVGVTSATETPFYDGTNCYDGQIITSTIIQTIERAYYGVSGVLGEVADAAPEVIEEFHDRIAERGLIFNKNSRGRYRFFFKSGDEVDTLEEQRRAFHLHSTGAVGTWDDASKEWAKEMAAAVASVWAYPSAQAVQRKFAARKIRLYAFKDSKKVVDGAPDTAVGRAFVAAYLSFAVNNPTRANKHLGIGTASFDGAAWTLDWLIHVLKELTFGPRIAIYPHRYDAIRKPLERYYGLDLPDFAQELKQWQADMEMDPASREDILDEDLKGKGKEPTFTTTREIQQLLHDMGYDLGPAGVDGREGSKTRDAIMTFQRLNGLKSDGIVGPKTRTILLETYRQRVCR